MTKPEINITPVTVELDHMGIPYKFFRHSGQLHSLEQAAQERGQRPEQVIRSILFRISKDEFIMVLVAGPLQVSWGKLRKYLGQSRMSMASEHEVLSYGPSVIESRHLVCRPIRIVIDKSVML
jgi:prolyl-tRNA editing enzyme YbaK/EbsC (Cys-tRNA(Pro) deacylase)